jgi:hypothetical protein
MKQDTERVAGPCDPCSARALLNTYIHVCYTCSMAVSTKEKLTPANQQQLVPLNGKGSCPQPQGLWLCTALHSTPGVLRPAPGLVVLSTIYALSTAAGTATWPTDVSHTRLTSASGGAVLLSLLAWMASTISCRTKGQRSSTGISATHEPDYSKTGLGTHDGASW